MIPCWSPKIIKGKIGSPRHDACPGGPRGGSLCLIVPRTGCAQNAGAGWPTSVNVVWPLLPEL